MVLIRPWLLQPACVLALCHGLWPRLEQWLPPPDPYLSQGAATGSAPRSQSALARTQAHWP
eukprot:928287-Lingulodinium_polyedra.AAC.1